MNSAERIKIITQIAAHLQSEHNTVQINLILGGYGIKTEEVDIVSSKKNYVIQLLKNEPPENINKIAIDLGLIENKEVAKDKKSDPMVNQSEEYKIFISHSSKNVKYGNSLVELLTGIGIKHEQLIFTSNVAYGIPIGENIFDWLKNRITEKPFVIYLLSTEYYSSVACLNEMGAAWVIENENAMIFTPDFNLNSYEFQNGAIDPRKIGFFINDKDRVTGFVESLKSDFDITKNQVLINQKTDEFLSQIEKYVLEDTTVKPEIKSKDLIAEPDEKTEPEAHMEKLVHQAKGGQNPSPKITYNGFAKLHRDLGENKLKDEELLLIQYIVDTGRYKLGTGWQENNEIENIKVWEDLQDLNNTLSYNYSTVLKRFDMRKLVEVSDLTSYGNPKEMKLTDEMVSKLFEHQDEFESAYDAVKERNGLDSLSIKNEDNNDDLPF